VPSGLPTEPKLPCVFGEDGKIIAQKFDAFGKIVEDRQMDSRQDAITVAENVMAVGAHNHDQKGAVYVYQKNTLKGSWDFETKLVGEADKDKFGFCVAMTANMLVVGAEGADNYKGSAYVYLRDTKGEWEMSQTLLRSNREDSGYNYFGSTVEITDSVIVVGGEDRKIYIFEHDGSMWKEVQIIKDVRLFGVSNNVLVTVFAKTPYIYTRSSVSGKWEMTQEMDQTTTYSDSLSILEDTIAFGYGDEKDKETGKKGAVYIFTKEKGGTWKKTQTLRLSDGYVGWYFGYFLSITENMLVVSSDFMDYNSRDYKSSVYMFSRKGDGTWEEVKKVVTERDVVDDIKSISAFGTTVMISISGDDGDKGSVFYNDLNCVEE